MRPGLRGGPPARPRSRVGYGDDPARRGEADGVARAGGKRGGDGARAERTLEELAGRARRIPARGPTGAGADRSGRPDPRTPEARPAGRALRRATVALLAVFALVSVAVSAEYAMSYGESYPGVTMRGVYLGGLGPDELLGEISDATGGGQLADYTFRARQPFAGASAVGGSANVRRKLPRSFTLRASELGIDFSSRQSAERAFAVGREGSPGRQLKERIGVRFSKYPIAPAIGYDRELAEAAISGMAREVGVAPEDASINISADGVDLVEHAEGISVDIEATISALESALGDLEREIPLTTEIEQPEILTAGARPAAGMARDILSDPPDIEAEGSAEILELDAARTAGALSAVPRPREGAVALSFDAAELRDAISEYVADVERPPEDAEVVPDEGSPAGAHVEPAVAGLEAEPAALEEALAEGVPAGDTRFTLPTREIRPQLQTGEAEQMLPTGTLGEHTASYSAPDGGDDSSGTDVAARAENLDALADALDGTLIAPSDSVSLNSIVAGEEVSLHEGGGLGTQVSGEDALGASQLASALYRAALASGMEIAERHPGSQPLPYAVPGLEAVVRGPYSEDEEERDLVVANPTGAYMIINAQVIESGTQEAAVEVSVSGREDAFPADEGPAVEVGSTRAAESGAEGEGAEWVSYTEDAEGQRTVVSRDRYSGGGEVSDEAPGQDSSDSSGSVNDSEGGSDE